MDTKFKKEQVEVFKEYIESSNALTVLKFSIIMLIKIIIEKCTFEDGTFSMIADALLKRNKSVETLAISMVYASA